jgi:hypothetical protein
LTNNLLEPITQLFRAQRPLWACEFSAKHLIAGGVTSSRKKVASKVATQLPSHAISGSLSEKNVLDPVAVRDTLKDLMSRSGFKGHEIGIVIPDDSTRVTFITAESLPSSEEERAVFIRWKLKKTVPFDVDTAQIAFTVIGSRTSGENKGTDLMVTLSPRSVIEEYEHLMDAMGYEAGYVVSSSLAALNRFEPPKGDVIFLKIAPGCISTMVFQDGRPEFYRKVAEMPLFDAIYPTLMYYQDKLGGKGLNSVSVCGYEGDLQLELKDLEHKLKIPVQKLGPNSIEDIFKPVLGAVDVVWAN